MPKKKSEQEEKPDWRKSKAKRLLEEDLTKGTIPLESDEMGAREVYGQRPEFSEFEYAHFTDRLRDLRKQIGQKKDIAFADCAALARDRAIYPKPAHNHRGEPRWEGSEAERLLRADISLFRSTQNKPVDLYRSRAEYYNNYPLVVFRGHIDQEVRRLKYNAYLKAKKKKKET
jgi:hypothetical protein